MKVLDTRMKGWCALMPVIALSGCMMLPLPESSVAGDDGRPARQEEFSQPRLAVSTEQAVSLAAAYKQQRSAVLKALDGRPPGGFKAGLTTVESRQRFSLREPIAGVLWPDSAIAFSGDPAVISRSRFRRPMLEVELAFRINTLIPEPLADVAEVHYVVSDVMPAIELPDLGFDSAVGVTGEAIVAANAGARYFLIGAPRPVEQVDINAVRATLSHNGERLQRAEATQVMGSQWRALYWLINKMVSEGWVIQPGQILLTGAMGEMLPLEQGLYQANFTELGELVLQVD